MPKTVNKERLLTGALELGLSLDEKQVEQFQHYLKILDEWNKNIDLTAVPVDEYVDRHLLDSLALVSVYKFNGQESVIDIGSGAGLPGIPIKIAFPDLKITLLDSQGKRVKFLNYAVKELKLKDTTVVLGRAEILAHNNSFRESFDIAIARAVAHLSILAEIMTPFLKISGVALAIKGERVNAEINDAKKTVSLLKDSFSIEDEKNKIVVLRKKTKTPAAFPRDYNKIKNSLVS